MRNVSAAGPCCILPNGSALADKKGFAPSGRFTVLGLVFVGVAGSPCRSLRPEGPTPREAGFVLLGHTIMVCPATMMMERSDSMLWSRRAVGVAGELLGVRPAAVGGGLGPAGGESCHSSWRP